jgi:hypothetical protein
VTRREMCYLLIPGLKPQRFLSLLQRLHRQFCLTCASRSKLHVPLVLVLCPQSWRMLWKVAPCSEFLVSSMSPLVSYLRGLSTVLFNTSARTRVIKSRSLHGATILHMQAPHNHIKSIPLLWYVPEHSRVDYVYARVILGYAQAPNDVSFCWNILLRSIWPHKHSGS